MSLIEYSNLLYEVGEKIAWITEGRRLLFICRAFLPDGCENSIQDVLSLLIKLEEEDQLGIDSLDVLKDVLKRMGKWDLLHIVEKFENKRREYKRLLEQCGRVLEECNQLERLISVCKGKISREGQEHITDVWTLFTELEKQNNLGIERLEILKTMAVEMEKPGLLEQVEKFKEKTKQEEDAERSQAQTAAVLASASYAGGRLIGIVTPLCTFRNVTGGIVAVTTWMILRRSSSLQEFVNNFSGAVLPLGNTLRALSEGSLCFTVQAQTTLALEALWKTYQDGTLQRKLQEFLITEEIKQLVGSEVKLTVKIDEQEYETAAWDLITTEAQEMEVKEERKGFEDQPFSDFAHGRAKEAHSQAREQVSKDTDISIPDRIAFVEEYLANLQETYSVAAETTDSGLWSQSATSELELYKGTEDIQELLVQVDERMKGISKKLDILTEPGGVATRDKDILDNIQQVKKEMETIRKTLDTLGKPKEKTKYGGSGLAKRLWGAVTRKKKQKVPGRITPQRSKEFIPAQETYDNNATQVIPWGVLVTDPRQSSKETQSNGLRRSHSFPGAEVSKWSFSASKAGLRRSHSFPGAEVSKWSFSASKAGLKRPPVQDQSTSTTELHQLPAETLQFARIPQAFRTRLLSQTVSAIPFRFLTKICMKLDTLHGSWNDYRFLAEKFGLSKENISLLYQETDSPTKFILQVLESQKDPSIGRFKEILEKIGRNDVAKEIEDWVLDEWMKK